MTMTWMAAIDAVHLIAPTVGGDEKAKKAIFERLIDGAIPARARWAAMGIDLGQPYVMSSLVLDGEDGSPSNPKDALQKLLEKTKPTVAQNRIGDGLAFSVNGSCKLPRGFWLHAKPRDLKRWDWANGFVIVKHDPGKWQSSECRIPNSDRFPMRSFAYGVEFEKAAVASILGERKTEALQSLHSKRGRPPSPKTAYWVAELILLFDDPNVEFERLSPDNIHDRIEETLRERGEPVLSRNSAYPIAQKVLAALARK